MNRFSIFSLLFFLNIFLLSAQEDAKYLVGAVPLVDGKVIFEREIKVSPDVPTSKLLKLAEEWAKKELVEKKYEGSLQRILLVSPENGYLVVQGDEKLVFKSQFLSLDQTTMTYQLIINVEQGKCTLTIRNIKYEYQDYEELMPAEKMITDEYALNKSGEKLNRHYDKFRKFTIDRVDELRNSLKDYLGQISLESIKKQEEVVTKPSILDSDRQEVVAQISKPIQETAPIVAPVAVQPLVAQVSPAPMSGYKQMSASEISESIMQMFKDNQVLVVAGESNGLKVMPALWSGLGSFGSKPVSMSIVKSEGANEDIYTISFYTQIHKDALDRVAKGEESKLTPITTPSGAIAFAEAWMIIECKKVLEQPATETMVKDAQSKQWNVSGFDKLLMGEIINVWAR